MDVAPHKPGAESIPVASTDQEAGKVSTIYGLHTYKPHKTGENIAKAPSGLPQTEQHGTI